MSDFTDFTKTVNDWINREYDDNQIAQWMKFAEERLSLELRCADMIKDAVLDTSSGKSLLPGDWRELHFVRVTGGKPLVYTSMAEFYNLLPYQTAGKYTIVGNNIVVGGETIPASLDISYFGDVPQMTEDATWLYSRYRRLYLFSTMAAGEAFGLHDERAALWESYTQSVIEKMNVEFKVSLASGSTINKRIKSFG